MKPPQKEFERVATDDFIAAVLEDIKYDPEHEFKYQGQASIETGVRFMFRLDGYKEMKGSGWLKFKYAEKANIYKKYIVSLVENPKPFMDFDIEQLRGMKVKILFKDSEDSKYQNVDTIRPVGPKIKPDASFKAPEPKAIEATGHDAEKEEEVPF